MKTSLAIALALMLLFAEQAQAQNQVHRAAQGNAQQRRVRWKHPRRGCQTGAGDQRHRGSQSTQSAAENSHGEKVSQPRVPCVFAAGQSDCYHLRPAITSPTDEY